MGAGLAIIETKSGREEAVIADGGQAKDLSSVGGPCGRFGSGITELPRRRRRTGKSNRPVVITSHLMCQKNGLNWKSGRCSSQKKWTISVHSRTVRYSEETLFCGYNECGLSYDFYFYELVVRIMVKLHKTIK